MHYHFASHHCTIDDQVQLDSIFTQVAITAWQGFICHDDVIKWRYFPRYWPFVRGVHRSPVNSPHKGQWRGAFMFSLICVWINGWVNNREAGDLRRHRGHYDVIVMCLPGDIVILFDNGETGIWLLVGTYVPALPYERVLFEKVGPRLFLCSPVVAPWHSWFLLCEFARPLSRLNIHEKVSVFACKIFKIACISQSSITTHEVSSILIGQYEF